MRRLCQAGSLLVCSLPILSGIPQWATASWVGACWGTLWLTGLSATWTCRRLAWMLYLAVALGLAHASLSSVTGLDRNSIWLVITVLLGSGWLTGMAVVPWSTKANEPGRSPGIGHSLLPTAPFSSIRFSVWDIVCVTSLVALACTTIPRVEQPFDLSCRFAPAIVGGVVMSLLAVQWSWRDKWSLMSLASCGACLLAAVLLIVPWFAVERDYSMILAILAWVVSGPLCAMAAQFIIVLLWTSASRPSRP